MTFHIQPEPAIELFTIVDDKGEIYAACPTLEKAKLLTAALNQVPLFHQCLENTLRSLTHGHEAPAATRQRITAALQSPPWPKP